MDEDVNEVSKTAFIYARSGTAEEEELFQIQLAICLELTRRLDAIPTGVFEDHNSPASDLSRQGLKSMLAKLQGDSRVDYVVTTTIGRLAEQRQEAMELLQRINKAGAELCVFPTRGSNGNDLKSARKITRWEEFDERRLRVLVRRGFTASQDSHPIAKNVRFRSSQTLKRRYLAAGDSSHGLLDKDVWHRRSACES